eukprot:4841042-Prymnesium_polylepis.1
MCAVRVRLFHARPCRPVVGQQPSSVIESPAAAPGPHVGEAWPLCQSRFLAPLFYVPLTLAFQLAFGSGSRSQLALPVHTPS